MKRTTRVMQTVRKKSRFRDSSLFFQTCVILLLLFLSVSLLFVFSLNRVERAHRRTAACQTNLELLTGASDMAEIGLRNIRSDLGAVIWNADAISFFMDPERNDPQRQYRITQMFTRLAKANSWIRSFWMTSVLSGKVLTMDGGLAPLEDFPDGPLLQQSPWGELPSDPEEPERNAELLLCGGRLFWVEPFVTDRPIGFLTIEIDMEALCRSLKVTELEAGLYSGDGLLVSPKEMTPGLPESLSFSEPSDFVTDRGQDPRRASWYLAENDFLDLRFLKRVDRSAFETTMAAALLPALPGILILGAAVLLISYLLADRIYRPINYLARQVLGQARGKGTKPDPDLKNELARLELSFFRTMDQNRAMKGRLEHFSLEIEEEVFRKILQGKKAEDAGLQFLDETVLEFWQDGRKMSVIACRRKGSWNVSDSFLDAQLFHVTIAGVLEKQRDIFCRTVSMGTCLEAVLISGGGEKSVKQVRQEMENLIQELREVFRPAACEIITGSGAIVTEKSRLAACWREALHQVDYQVYLEGTPRAREREQDAEEQELRAYYREQWNRILHMAEAGNQGEAEKATEDYLEAFWQTEPGPGELVQFYRRSGSALTERLLAEYNIRVSELPELEETQAAGMTAFERKQWIRHQLHSVLQQAETSFRKKGNRYVMDAMNYIRDHYENRDLSVQDVADHLGITSNYFSTIFHESTGSSFVAYLNQVRVEQAVYLLKETKIPIGDIGFRCGFNTVQHFNRTFKKITGMPPSQYRNEGGGAEQN